MEILSLLFIGIEVLCNQESLVKELNLKDFSLLRKGIMRLRTASFSYITDILHRTTRTPIAILYLYFPEAKSKLLIMLLKILM